MTLTHTALADKNKDATRDATGVTQALCEDLLPGCE